MCLWNLTVCETVTFAAKLRLPQTTPETEKNARVAELLEILGLSHIADSIVGKEGRRGISGGERKRVSIGVELITKPDVLFLDEPTSGLGAVRGGVIGSEACRSKRRWGGSGEGGGGGYSCVACRSRLTIVHASLLRRSTVPTRTKRHLNMLGIQYVSSV